MSRVGRRRFITAVGGSGVVLGLAGCIGDDDDENGETPDDTPTPGETPVDENGVESIGITMRQGPTTLDPHNHRETTTDVIILNSYEQLLNRDFEGDIIPQLATDWEEVDPTHHRFHIREGVEFHNGDEFTAEDAAFSIMRVRDDDVGNLQSPQHDQIPGIVDAEASDDYTLEVYSDAGNPMIFGNLASYTPMMSEAWVMDNEPEVVGEQMMGTGPYEVAEYAEGEFITFERFEDYWGDLAPIPEVTFDDSTEDATRVASLTAGEIELADAVPPASAPDVAALDGFTIAEAPSTRILMMPMIYNREPFTSQEFRQALNYAIDLDTIISEILQGFGAPTGQPTLEGYVGHNPDVEPYPYDPEMAEQLIDDSGFAGEHLEIHNPTGRYLLNDEITEAVAGYIDELPNVSAEMVPRDFGELAGQLLDGDIDSSPSIFQIGWGNTTFDAQANLLPWLTEGTSQYTFVDEDLEDLIHAAEVEEDPEEREQLLMDACELAHELAVFIFLNREFLVYGMNENRISWNARADENVFAHEIEPAS